MVQIEKAFKDRDYYVMHYPEIEQILKEDHLPTTCSQGENGYIDIEYYNEVGQYKMNFLLQLFQEHKEFYQFFLRRCKKVVIKSNYPKTEGEIVISDSVGEIYLEELLDQIFLPQEKDYYHFTIDKFKNNKRLVSETESIDLIRTYFLKNDLENKKIDFFKYLDLTKGKIINTKLYFQKALIDLALEYNCYPLLAQYMYGTNQEQIELAIVQELHKRYGLTLLNTSLEDQKKLLKEESKSTNSDFLEKNLELLNNIFLKEVPKIIEKFCLTKVEPPHLKQEDILKLVNEFLEQIDPTNSLVQEFKINLENKTILLWNPKDTDQRKHMQEKYYKKLNIDEPACYSEINLEGNRVNNLVVVPMTYTLSDVCSIVHEFFHLHNNLSTPKKMKSPILTEVISIYFEEYVLNFLKEKGYQEQELPINFRIIDAFFNFQLVLPSLTYLSEYLKKGEITIQFIQEGVEKIFYSIVANCRSLGLTEEETNNELVKAGFNTDMENVILNCLWNVNNILLRYDECILRASPYLIGTILSKTALEKKISQSDILKISQAINDIENPWEVFLKMGIAPNDYIENDDQQRPHAQGSVAKK